MEWLGTAGGWYLSAYQTFGTWLGLLPLALTGASLAWAGVRRLPGWFLLLGAVALIFFGYVLPLTHHYQGVALEIETAGKDHVARRCEEEIYTDDMETSCKRLARTMTRSWFGLANEHALNDLMANAKAVGTSSLFYVAAAVVLVGMGARWGGDALRLRQTEAAFLKLHPQ